MIKPPFRNKTKTINYQQSKKVIKIQIKKTILKQTQKNNPKEDIKLKDVNIETEHKL